MYQWITEVTQKIENWASEADIVYNFAARYYHDVIKKEIVLANITKRDHILCIGGGICPFSAILLHQATGAKVTVIDNNMDCVLKARQVIARLGLKSFVTVLCQDGSSRNLSFSEYTVIHFALQVCPMECVFSHVEKYVAPGTKLLIRRPKRQLGKMYSRFFAPMLTSCPLTIHKNARNIGSTILYVKQGNVPL